MTDQTLGREAEEAPPRGRPWYHRPEWIMALLAVVSVAGGAVVATAQGAAQTDRNTRDISALAAKVDPMPERLGRIETKLDDLTAFEKRRRDRAPE